MVNGHDFVPTGFGMKAAYHRTGPSYRNRPYLNAFVEVPCIRCLIHKGIVKEHTVPAHYTGEFQHMFGKGLGDKCDDHCTWSACQGCHTEADDPSVVWKEGTKSELQMFYILMTQVYLLGNDMVSIK